MRVLNGRVVSDGDVGEAIRAPDSGTVRSDTVYKRGALWLEADECFD